ncbi:hypothetical protein JSMCR1_p227 (plasmid) [Escherichia coli]|nr:hypothetical protein JSMCR1_p227 [Escherichia coli]
MLSQLTLRFHKKLIEALKIRAGPRKYLSQRPRARFLDDGLKRPLPATVIFSLSPIRRHRPATVPIYHSRPDFGTAPVSRDELRFILAYAGRPLSAARTGWQHSRPCAPCSTSPATCCLAG